MNLANKLTLLRIFLVPVFLVFLVAEIPYGTVIATAIFIIASLTDKLDGYIARSRNQITNFGKFMDPLADKLLVTAALISLVELKIVPSWAAFIIIAREFSVSGLRTIAASEGIVLAASKLGKLKTVIQIVAIIFALIQANFNKIGALKQFAAIWPLTHSFLYYMTYISLYAAIIITIISGVDYFVKNKDVINTNK